jgi:hypothetical protein
MGGIEFGNDQSGNTLYKFMINLRLFFPDIWASGLLPEELLHIVYLLWLDSDLTIHKNVFNLFEICKSRPNQPMFGANLLYHKNPHPPKQRLITFNEMEEVELIPNKDFNDYEYGGNHKFIISGGIVLWNIKTIVNDCRSIEKNVFARTIKEDLNLIYSTEERVFTEYSARFLVEKNNYPGTLQYAILPIAYNVVPDVVMDFFEHSQHLPEEDIVIFHWDGIRKPWELTRIDERSDFIAQQDARWQEIAATTEFYGE